jgi:uncharacterized protein YkwD
MPRPTPALRLALTGALLAFLAPCLAACGAGGWIEDLVPEAEDSSTPPLPQTGTTAAMSDAERAYAMEVLRLVNEERARASLGSLEWHESGAAAAYAHSIDMDLRDFFSHVNPSGEDPGARIAHQGIAPVWGWGENIARGYPSPAAVVTAWMGSEGHRENILRPTFTHLGVGVHSDGDLWWTQVFLDLQR